MRNKEETEKETSRELQVGSRLEPAERWRTTRVDGDEQRLLGNTCKAAAAATAVSKCQVRKQGGGREGCRSITVEARGVKLHPTGGSATIKKKTNRQA